MTYDKNKIECNYLPVNKGFLDAHEHFSKCGWNIKTNTHNTLSYVKSVNILDEFTLNVDKNLIIVLIPIYNSKYAYKTYFNSYFEASEYIISRLYDYEQL
jgi:hypothetical protein